MTRWNNHLKTIVLLGALSALLVGVGNVVAPGHLGFFAILALGMNLGAYFFSTHPATADRIARLEAIAGGRRLGD